VAAPLTGRAVGGQRGVPGAQPHAVSSRPLSPCLPLPVAGLDQLDRWANGRREKSNPTPKPSGTQTEGDPAANKSEEV